VLRFEEQATLGRHAAAWDALVDSSPLPAPFLRSWWLGSVAQGEALFVLVFDGDELVGGAAFQRRTRGGCEWVEMLGDGPLEPDHLDLVAAPDRVAEVVEQIRRWAGRPGNRVLDLRGLVDDSWLADALPRRATRRTLQVAPFTPLPDTVAEYLAGRPGNLRSTIKRSAKRLAGAGVEPRVRDAGDVDGALSDLRDLHDERWGEQSSFLDAWDGFAAAMRAGAAAGEVRFTDLVEGTGRVVAIELELIVGRRASFYQAGRLDERELRGSGSVLKVAVIERLIAEGCVEFDFLRGDESYKADWSIASRPLMAAQVGFGPLGIALDTAARAKRFALVTRWRARQRIASLRQARSRNR
jgi:CelD/BcsL family acetyltransferase involved in cellulose biosynthesis